MAQRPIDQPNQALQQTTAAKLVSRILMVQPAAAAAELGRSPASCNEKKHTPHKHSGLGQPCARHHAQRQSSRRRHGARLSRSKPSVNISFLRFGKREPIHTGESDDGVWLRLHNNTRWPLVLNAQGAAGHVFALATEEEVGLFVSVEEVPEPRLRMIREISPSDIPPALPESLREKEVEKQQPSMPRVEEERNCSSPYVDSCHVCSSIKLAPGKSFVFSVPREILCQKLKIYISLQL